MSSLANTSYSLLSTGSPGLGPWEKGGKVPPIPEVGEGWLSDPEPGALGNCGVPGPWVHCIYLKRPKTIEFVFVWWLKRIPWEDPSLVQPTCLPQEGT